MKLNVIVVDDDDDVRNVLKFHLEDLGCEVATASSPLNCDVYRGHECGKSRPCYDALIADYNMPAMTGLEFIEMLQKRGCKGSAANRLLISGNTACIDAERVKKAGCVVMSKPLNLKDFDEWLEGVFRCTNPGS